MQTSAILCIAKMLASHGIDVAIMPSVEMTRYSQCVMHANSQANYSIAMLKRKRAAYTGGSQCPGGGGADSSTPADAGCLEG